MIFNAVTKDERIFLVKFLSCFLAFTIVFKTLARKLGLERTWHQHSRRLRQDSKELEVILGYIVSGGFFGATVGPHLLKESRYAVNALAT